MYTGKKIYFLAERLSQILGLGKIIDIREASMGSYEKGFSGAEIFRIECLFENGRKDSFICKKADLKERMVMRRLTAQGHRCTPAAYSDDCSSLGPEWMLLQDLGKRVPAPQSSPVWMRNVASAFAEIHGNNICGFRATVRSDTPEIADGRQEICRGYGIPVRGIGMDDPDAW